MESKIDFSKIISIPGVENIKQLGNTFFVSYHRAPKDLKVDVFKSLKNGMFTGKCNYAFWGPDQADPYRDLHSYPSIEQDWSFQSTEFGIMITQTLRMI